MKEYTANLQILTPCFCVGADNRQAELRAPSVRGQLRWWFRVLGGTPAPELEKSLFGGVHKLPSEREDDEHTAASKIIVRTAVTDAKFGSPAELPQQNRPGYYLLHFANVSSRAKGEKGPGPRVQNQAWFAPYTAFQISVLERRPMTDQEVARFQQTWKAFLLLGSLGLRQTRGFGAFAPMEPIATETVVAQLKELKRTGVDSWIVTMPNGAPAYSNEWKEAMIRLEAVLGYLRQNRFSAGQSGKNPTPLGTSSNPRQASALHLRPIRTSEGILPVVFFTPQILGESSQMRLADFKRTLANAMDIRTPYKQQIPDPATDTRTQIALTPCQNFLTT